MCGAFDHSLALAFERSGKLWCRRATGGFPFRCSYFYGPGLFSFLLGLLARQLSKPATTGKTGEAVSALAWRFISRTDLLNLAPLKCLDEATSHLFCHSKPCHRSAEMSRLDLSIDHEYVLPGPQHWQSCSQLLCRCPW